MDDLIFRKAAIAEVMHMVKVHEREIFRGELLHYTGIKAMLEAQPAVDAAPVVRCKKCVHWLRDTLRQNSNDVAWWNEAVCDRHSYDGLEIIKKWTSADFYCADGERRDDDGKAN